MFPILIVKPEIITQAFMQLVPVSVSPQVKMFVFNSPAPADRPKPFDKNIIQSVRRSSATFPIHTNLYIISNQRVEKRVASKLATMVGVENFRFTPLS